MEHIYFGSHDNFYCLIFAMYLRTNLLRSVVVIMLSYQPSAPRFDSRLGSECVTQYARTGKEMHEAIFFLLQNLALHLGLGQGCQPEGIAIT